MSAFSETLRSHPVASRVIGMFHVANKETDYTEATSARGDHRQECRPLLIARLRRKQAREALRASEEAAPQLNVLQGLLLHQIPSTQAQLVTEAAVQIVGADLRPASG